MLKAQDELRKISLQKAASHSDAAVISRETKNRKFDEAGKKKEQIENYLDLAFHFPLNLPDVFERRESINYCSLFLDRNLKHFNVVNFAV